VDPASGELTGHASLLVDQPAGRMRLGYIIVDPQRRGQSLGRELVQDTMRAGFRLTGLSAMKLHVYAHNTPARRLYASLGFRETGVSFRVDADDNAWEALEMEVRRSERAAANEIE
jgi:ribosomal protein S18 acetylase RimI-like enzyme